MQDYKEGRMLAKNCLFEQETDKKMLDTLFLLVHAHKNLQKFANIYYLPCAILINVTRKQIVSFG